MLVTLKDILNNAEQGGYAVPAFNVYNMETVMGVIEAAEAEKAPVILQVYSRLFDSDNAYYLSPVILAAAAKATVPVCYHLDHGAGEAEVTRAIRYGCSGIMFDASSLPLEENIAKTSEIVKLCTYAGISTEGEIGHIGSVNDTQMAAFTTVEEAVSFAEATKVDALAILVGTAHGRYKQKPNLDLARIREIHATVKTHLVLHGGSGVPDEQVKEAIVAGIRKINFGTDICYSFLDRVFETSRTLVGIDLFMRDAIASVKRFATEKITLLGAKDRYV